MYEYFFREKTVAGACSRISRVLVALCKINFYNKKTWSIQKYKDNAKVVIISRTFKFHFVDDEQFAGRGNDGAFKNIYNGAQMYFFVEKARQK